MYSHVVVCKGLCKCLFCLLVVGKLLGLDVSLFEGLVERLDVHVSALLDELVLADAQGLNYAPKVMAGVLVVVVSAQPSSGTAGLTIYKRLQNTSRWCGSG